MNDPQLDEALRAALDVDHAPGFQARVRARVAAEPAPSLWQAAWPSVARGGSVAIGTAGLVMVIALIRGTPVTERDDSSVAQVATTAAASNRTADLAAPALTPPSATDASRPAAAPRRRAALSPPEALPLPDVIVSEDDGRALVLIARLAQAGLALPPAPREHEMAMEPLPALSRIEVPEVAVIEPLVIARLAEGDSQ